MTKPLQLMIFLFILGFFFKGCHNNKKEIITIPFTHEKNVCDEAGMPLDTFAMYFPEHLFLDSIPSVYYNKKFYHLGAWFSKGSWANFLGVSEDSLKDTLEIVQNKYYCKRKSFLLYQMKEPVLNNHYLGRNIYRLTILLKLNKPPMVIRLDDYRDSVLVTVKILNRYIVRPFAYYIGAESIIYHSPEIAYYDMNLGEMIIVNKKKYKEMEEESKERNKIGQIIIDREYNFPKYFLLKDFQYKINEDEMNTLNKMIDTSEFWYSNPIIEMCKVYGSCIPIWTETNDWILEGHTENGYQVKVIMGPNFKNDRNDKYASKQLYYARVFEYILSLAPVRCNNWLHRYSGSRDYWQYQN